MPYGLFDYIPDSNIHTMGLSPLPYQPAQQFRDNVTGQVVDRSVLESKATFYGGNMTAAQQNAKAQQLAQEISTRYSPVQPTPVSSVKVGGGGGGASQSQSGRISTGSTLTNPYTLRMPEDPSQAMPTTAALYEEGNLPPQSTPKPPSGGGQCPPGYTSVNQQTAPSPSPAPYDPRITYPGIGGTEEAPGTQPTTMAAICSENPAFCPTETYPTQTYPNQSSGSYTPPGGWGAYNPYTRGTTGSEDIRNYPEIAAQRNAEMMAAQQKATELGRNMFSNPGEYLLSRPRAR